MSTFSETMRRIRFEKHMTQEEFADLLGTTKQNISRYESGAVSPKISTAAAIADKLGISLSELSGKNIETVPAPANESLSSSQKADKWIMLTKWFGNMEMPEFDMWFNAISANHPDNTERK